VFKGVSRAAGVTRCRGVGGMGVRPADARGLQLSQDCVVGERCGVAC
jgi:hypothetical protein